MIRSPRRVGLLDAMILIAAIAVGLAWARYRDPFPPQFEQGNPEVGPLIVGDGPNRPVFVICAWGMYGAAWAFPCCVTTAFALLAITIRLAWPRVRRVFRQPGTASCVAAVITTFLLLLWNLLANLIKAVNDEEGIDWRNIWTSCVEVDISSWTVFTGFATLTALSILSLSGVLRCDRSAIDRIGRALGCFWIVTMILACAYEGIQ
jgi:hypothetical protein